MSGREYEVWSFVMLKGGVRKTTSTMFCAQALARRGPEVLVVDADAGTQGVTEWTTRMYVAGNEPAHHVSQWGPRYGIPLAPFVAEQQQRTGAAYVLIDVGAEFPEVARMAAIMSTLCVLPIGAEPAELARLAETSTLVEQANPAALRRVLLTRVPQPGKGTARTVRELLTTEGYSVLQQEIPHNRDVYAHVFGQQITDLGAYDQLTEDLTVLTNPRPVARHGR